MAKETAVLEPEVEVKARKLLSREAPTFTLVVESPRNSFTDPHTLKGVAAVRGCVLKFEGNEVMVAAEWTKKVMDSPGYRTDFVFADDWVANQKEPWAKEFMKRMDLKREICNLKPYLENKGTFTL